MLSHKTHDGALLSSLSRTVLTCPARGDDILQFVSEQLFAAANTTRPYLPHPQVPLEWGQKTLGFKKKFFFSSDQR